VYTWLNNPVINLCPGGNSKVSGSITRVENPPFKPNIPSSVQSIWILYCFELLKNYLLRLLVLQVKCYDSRNKDRFCVFQNVLVRKHVPNTILCELYFRTIKSSEASSCNYSILPYLLVVFLTYSVYTFHSLYSFILTVLLLLQLDFSKMRELKRKRIGTRVFDKGFIRSDCVNHTSASISNWWPVRSSPELMTSVLVNTIPPPLLSSRL